MQERRERERERKGEGESGILHLNSEGEAER
jgi:hypothetical protein